MCSSTPGCYAILLYDFEVLFKDFTPDQVLIHPEYNSPNRFQNDIAIVRLDGNVTVNGEVRFVKFESYILPYPDYVSPVCLPFPELMPENLDDDPEVAGWGAIDIYARRFTHKIIYIDL